MDMWVKKEAHHLNPFDRTRLQKDMWVKKDAVIRRMLTYADVCGQKG
jgi:hypothetical protein